MKHLLWFIVFFQIAICFGQADHVILDEERYVESLKTTYKVLPELAIVSKLTSLEFMQLKEIEERSIKEYNRRIKQGFKKNGEKNYSRLYRIKKLKNYKVQYIPYLNEKGEKEVWINGFCEDFESNWKKELLHAFDGGNCFFTMKINLTTNECLSIGTNGYS